MNYYADLNDQAAEANAAWRDEARAASLDEIPEEPEMSAADFCPRCNEERPWCTC